MADHLITSTITYAVFTCGNLSCMKTWEQPNTPLDEPGWTVCPHCLWSAPTNVRLRPVAAQQTGEPR